ncbi:hypothetical protein K7X08_027813 [Anisodus acutangulus]|uniref:Uncharacterized protein n=1 Tax=Anisodus acutangulus TaxID=402998 RepID=A0A9Q1LND1_9SOLA|nr:hypothetical protein K7X08_027813 [Anisodus acutangulus]
MENDEFGSKWSDREEETEGSIEEAHSQDSIVNLVDNSYDSTKTHYGGSRGDSLNSDGVIIEKAEEIVKNEDMPPDKPPYYADKFAIEVEGDMMIADQTDARLLSQAETEPCVKIPADDNNNGKSVSTEKMSPNAILWDIVSYKVTQEEIQKATINIYTQEDDKENEYNPNGVQKENATSGEEISQPGQAADS